MSAEARSGLRRVVRRPGDCVQAAIAPDSEED